jgi:hypothetical protein
LIKGVLAPYPGRLVASLLLALLSAGTLAAAPVDSVPRVFDPPMMSEPMTRVPPAIRAGFVTRWRPATTPPGVLTQPDGSPRLGVGQRIGLNLFDDASFTAIITDARDHGSGGRTWSGTLDGIDKGHVILAVRDGAVVGNVVVPGAVYRIGYAPDGTQVIEQIDTSALPREAPPLAPGPLATHDRAPDVAADSASRIDVMIVYTASARTAAGGTAAIKAEADEAVAWANQAYANNGLVQRLRLVFVGEVPIVETGDFSADLQALRVNATVASLRDTHRADLVSLFTDNGPSAGFCGIAYLMTVNSADFGPYAFSLVERQCAATNLTFAHELGHNMGAHHDPYVTGGEPGLFAYSHGYVDLGATFRTIMAYNTQCVDAGVHCNRLTYFSNPEQTVGGVVIGTTHTSDNARTLGETANTIANFRQGGAATTFDDMPASDPFWDWVEALVAAGVTSGCAVDPPLYCPTQVVTRAQMAVFLVRGIAYPDPAVPPAPAEPVFADVPAADPLRGWIEWLYAAKITGGCGTSPLLYCPTQAVTRGQMAVFLLRARHGSGYSPPAPAQQTFADVPLDHPFAAWIYGLVMEGITLGCGSNPNTYCPDSPVTRAQMAVFMVRTFDLPR